MANTERAQSREKQKKRWKRIGATCFDFLFSVPLFILFRIHANRNILKKIRLVRLVINLKTVSFDGMSAYWNK